MASDTVSTRSEAPRWRFSLARRIVAVNGFAVLALMGSVVYLDSFRERLIDQRVAELSMQARLIADFMASSPADGWPALLARYGRLGGTRLRLYDRDGRLTADSWRATGPTFELRDPKTEPFKRDVARALDRIIEGFGDNQPLPDYVEPLRDTVVAWAEARSAAAGRPAQTLRRAPDRTIIIGIATPVGTAAGIRPVLQLTFDTRDITRLVRSERATLGMVFLGVLAASILFSNFLASTIVRPLRRLAVSAQRVRLGRSREVTVPRFQKRRDEIGQLARSLSDMTGALRERIDATEAFAADVAHELKNPLASLRSAVDSLDLARNATQKAQLLEVIRDDVGRIDRLITDIADASRLDAELSRTRFEAIDLGELAGGLIRATEATGMARSVEIAYARPEAATTLVMGEGDRLAQVVRNLLDNAVSFSPDRGLVVITVVRAGDRVLLRVEDSGPGIPLENREDIFRRFYTERPADEEFGRHSGLGLAIVRTIVEAHDGSIEVGDREDGPGARFTVSLPAA